MLKAMLQRIGAALVVMVVVSILTFLVLRVIPGDPATVILGVDASPENIAALRASMGLDDPLPQQYISWIAGIFTGDWGTSHTYGLPVIDVIGTAVPVTLALAIYTMVIALVVSLILGVAAALRPGSVVDVIARVLMQLGSAAPAFWVAILLMLGFSSALGWFPVSGYTPFTQDAGEALRSLTLPAVTLAIGECGVLVRAVRASTMAALERSCMLSAQVKGLTSRRRIIMYALRSALVAPLTTAGLQFAKLLGGTVVVESIFSLPGLGRLLLTAVTQRDLELVQGIVLLTTVIVVLVTLIVDLLVMAAEPQVRQADTEVAA